MCPLVFILMASGWCCGQNGSLIASAIPATFLAASAGASSADAAQQTAPPAKQQVAEAPVIMVELTKSLDSRKLTAGDAIEAKVIGDARWNGKVVPRGSKVMGHITEASSRARGDAASALGIVFDRIALKDGTDLPLKADIQAVGPRPGFESAGMANPAPVSAPGTPGSMGGAYPNPAGLGAPQTNFPNPSAGMPAPPAQGDRQDSGGITAHSTGVVGLPDLQLGNGSILASSGKEVKVAAGSQLLLRVQSE